MSIDQRKRSASGEPLTSFDDPYDLANAVTAALSGPDYLTDVASTYSNLKNPGGEVQAYAKIAGNNWTYFVKSLETTIGRNTAPLKPDETPVDIDLGPAKVVSRKHAVITYNMTSRSWELRVSGRNGAKIDTVRIPAGNDAAPAILRCGTVIDIGGTQMMFILPETAPEISMNVLNSVAHKVSRLSEFIRKKPTFSNYPYDSQNRLTFSNSYQSQHLSNTPLYISTQEQYNIAAARSHLQSYNGLETDLSKEEAKDTKPPFSYATMITQAILSNPQGILSLAEIYDWIASHYAYYRYTKAGWQNSIRHNLSLNKAFEKVPRKPTEPGKGMKWQIAESYKQDFLNSLANGSIAKAKRGSSVSRQLQIHLATHHHLPSGIKKNNNNEDQSKLQDPSQSSHNGMMSSGGLSSKEMHNGYSAHSQNPMNSQNSNSSGSMGMSSQYNDSQGLSFMAAAAAANLSIHDPRPGQQLEDGRILGEREINSSESVPEIDKNQTPSPKLLNTSTNSNKENSYDKPQEAGINPTPNIDLMGFGSPNKAYTVSALESYTPERGSTKNLNLKQKILKDESHFQNGKTEPKSPLIVDNSNSENGIPNGHNLQASPAIWNFVQFGTPTSQTPKTEKPGTNPSKNEDDEELNKVYMEGSPIQQRRKV